MLRPLLFSIVLISSPAVAAERGAIGAERTTITLEQMVPFLEAAAAACSQVDRSYCETAANLEQHLVRAGACESSDLVAYDVFGAACDGGESITEDAAR